MAKRQARSQVPKVIFFIFLFLFLAGLVAFKAGMIKSDLFTSKTDNATELAKSVVIQGMVRLKDLKLSQGEVKQINRTVFKHRDVFSAVNVIVDYEDKQMARTEIKKNTLLAMYMVLDIDSDCQVRSWGKCVSRADFVPQMVRYIERAARELEPYKTRERMKRNFKKLYI